MRGGAGVRHGAALTLASTVTPPPKRQSRCVPLPSASPCSVTRVPPESGPDEGDASES